MSQKLESDVQSQIINYIKDNGGDAVKIMAPSRRGCPDIMANIKGRIFLIETKRKNKDLSGLQEYFFMIWNTKKECCIMADSLEMFKEKSRQLGIKL